MEENIQAQQLKKDQIANKVAMFNRLINHYYDLYKDHLKWFNIYTITITPVGKNKSHEETLIHLNRNLKKCKGIREAYLIREYQNTNHWHGIIITKQSTKLQKLINKRNYHFEIEEYYDDIQDTWLNYILKNNPHTLDLYINPGGLKRLIVQ